MPALQHNPAASRFELYRDGALAGFIQYRMQGTEMWFLYTAVTQYFQTTDVADALIRSALEEAHHRRVAVVPFCPAVRSFIAGNPPFLHLVPVGQRGRLRALSATKSSRTLAARSKALTGYRTVFVSEWPPDGTNRNDFGVHAPVQLTKAATPRWPRARAEVPVPLSA
ncbi:MAG: GNAT family N-acetyltransferase [Actinomycetales bacterium]|jgi:hypothetical protein